MKTKIEEEATEYAYKNDGGSDPRYCGLEDGFIAGAEFMQGEVNELKADNEFQASVMIEMGGIILENEKLKAQLEKAEDEVILRGEYYNRVKAQNEIMREALKSIKDFGYTQTDSDGHEIYELANEALKKVGDE